MKMSATKDKPLVNRVAKSGIVTIDLSSYFPGERIHSFDLSEILFKGLLLREKDFRTFVKEHDWTQYENAYLCVFCSTDAIIPMWAYMLMASSMPEASKGLHVGRKETLIDRLMRDRLENELKVRNLEGKPVVIKGCSDVEIPAGIYAKAVELVKPYARSVMFGEPCSTVPVYKRPKEK